MAILKSPSEFSIEHRLRHVVGCAVIVREACHLLSSRLYILLWFYISEVCLQAFPLNSHNSYLVSTLSLQTECTLLFIYLFITAIFNKFDCVL